MNFHGLDKCYLVKKAVQVSMEQRLLIVLMTIPPTSTYMIYNIDIRPRSLSTLQPVPSPWASSPHRPCGRPSAASASVR